MLANKNYVEKRKRSTAFDKEYVFRDRHHFKNYVRSDVHKITTTPKYEKYGKLLGKTPDIASLKIVNKPGTGFK
jgi:hypothetical protein